MKRRTTKRTRRAPERGTRPAAALVGMLLIAAAAAAAAPPTVAVSILPQAWFVERIAGDHVRVQVLVGPGDSPASFDPTPRQMIELARASAYLRIGVAMENALLPHVRRTLPGLQVVDLRDGLDLAPADTHGHDHQHGHDHGEFDPHVWLSPRQARTLARNTCEALVRLSPGQESAFRQGCAKLDSELVALDAELTGMLAPVEGKDLLVFHPAYGYLAADYGLRQVAVEQGGLSPSPRHLAEVIDMAKKRGIGAIFVQPQFSDSSARALAREAGLTIVELDPLARDYAANLRRMAAAIREGLE